ncbi:MAG: hypothetical protein JOS17DRAFT_549538 [Linnemannia elongata]|nr:MAG: hypothetical protein JOS17DRAFT_549538 [Linnemannia elongata]
MHSKDPGHLFPSFFLFSSYSHPRLHHSFSLNIFSSSALSLCSILFFFSIDHPLLLLLFSVITLPPHLLFFFHFLIHTYTFIPSSPVLTHPHASHSPTDQFSLTQQLPPAFFFSSLLFASLLFDTFLPLVISCTINSPILTIILIKKHEVLLQSRTSKRRTNRPQTTRAYPPYLSPSNP